MKNYTIGNMELNGSYAKIYCKNSFFVVEYGKTSGTCEYSETFILISDALRSYRDNLRKVLGIILPAETVKVDKELQSDLAFLAGFNSTEVIDN